MRFRKRINSNGIAIIASSTICLVIIGLIALLRPTAWKDWFTITAVLFQLLGSFCLFRFLVNRLVEDRIKLIYKSIYTKKKSRDDFLQKHRTNRLSSIEEEVERWLENREVEIEKMKEQEAFHREFISDVSHELKTPVFSMLGYLSTLLDGAIDDPEVNRNYLERAKASAERMSLIIETLGLISRFENFQIVPNYTCFNLEEAVKIIFDDYEIEAKECGVSLMFRNKMLSEPIVYADQHLIEHVVANLVENSIRYRNKEKPYMKSTIYDMHEKVFVEVSDNGVGVPENDLPRIFERFYRVDKARSREKGGSGLGLAIVKNIIDAHNQNITVRSTIGNGTTFSFTLDKSTSQK
jgi:two-component system phosphate regulon sensor histidine kinase PhoR